MFYSELVGVYEALEATSKRLEKTDILSKFLKKVPAEEVKQIMLLVQGKVFPGWDPRKIGMAAKLLLKALALSTGSGLTEIESFWRKTGDLGDAAQKLVGKKSQATLFSQQLTTQKVFSNLRKLATLEGAGSVDRKVKLVAELLTSAKPVEAKYIIRTILEDLRVGLGEGTVRDAIIWAFFGEKLGLGYDSDKNEILLPDRTAYNSYVELVQGALDIANDFSIVAKVAKEQAESGLKLIPLKPGKPVKVMLYQKVKDFPEAFETVGQPAAIEYKYDGFRLQVHKFDNKILLFTRRLEDVTAQFPEVVELVKGNVKGDSFIIDCEAVGLDPATKKYLPFQAISQRIKRKYDIAEMSKKFPVEIDIFDMLFYNGKSLLKEPFSSRRELLEKITTQIPLQIKLAEQIITDGLSKAEWFYEKSLNAGNEGVMVKSISSIYKPGSRVGYGVKVKPTMETLEVVIVGAEWGEGKRSEWLSSFTIAVRNPETGELVEIGKVGTGIKEKDEEGVSFGQLTELLKPLVIDEKAKEVKVRPEVIIEVNYEEIQASPTYSSGFALRFPRFMRLRTDRSVEDVSTLEEVQKLYDAQRGRSKN
jgi:DNA ligase-1